jgi:type I restriction enzyme M protein
MQIDVKEKDSKIWSYVRNKWLVKMPEEIVRQQFLTRLVNQYGYDINQIEEEVEITGSGSGKARADYVLWRTKDDKLAGKSPFIVVECKADNVAINQEVYFQGEHYARMAGARFFITHNNNETKYWRVITDKMPGSIEEIEDIPKADSTEKQVQELLSKLKVFKENEFADLLHQCHNIIRNREKLDPAAAFDEIAKVLFMKVYAERNLQADMKGNIFTLVYIEEGEKYNPDYLQTIFEKTKTDFGKDRIFDRAEKINLRENTIKAIVEKLERYNLSATSTDVKGIAFEKFLGKTFRGEIGQFFTPRPIVEFMVKMFEPKEGDVICDPASGSGGFLIRFFETVREKINRAVDEEYRIKREEISGRSDISEEKKARLLTDVYEELSKSLDPSIENSRMWRLANRYIYGTDANERMARTSKMNMIMHGDGHGGIHHHDGFLNVNGIFEERFNIVLTNPPFGQAVELDDVVVASQLEQDEEAKSYHQKVYGSAYDETQIRLKAHLGKPIASLFDLPRGRAIRTEILFIERCLSLLKPGGKFGIVLPEGVFNNPSLVRVRQFAEDKAFVRAVVSLPQETFFSTGASVKASLLFMQKFTEEEAEKWQRLLKKYGREKAKEDFDYPIFMCEAEHVGITSTGEEDTNDFSEILEQYLNFRENPSEFATRLAEPCQ